MAEDEGQGGGSVLVQVEGQVADDPGQEEAGGDGQACRGGEEGSPAAAAQAVHHQSGEEDGRGEAQGAQQVRRVQVRLGRGVREEGEAHVGDEIFS